MPPQVVASLWFIGETSMWSSLFYSHPLLYILAFMLINFIFAGLYAVFGLTVSHFVRYRFIVYLTPLIIHIFLYSIADLIQLENWAPANFLVPGYGYTRLGIVAIEASIFF